MTDSTDPTAGGKGRRHQEQPLGVLAVDGAQLTLDTIVQLTGLSKTTIYRLVRSGDFPRSSHVSTRAVRWRAEDVREWLGTRVRRA